jgi:hypothetical protein
MTDQHPVMPPDELVQQWRNSKILLKDALMVAAQWGADQELEACVEILNSRGQFDTAKAFLRIRRPKPPSLKEQALDDFNGLMQELDGAGAYSYCADRIRRALEALPE